MTGQQLPITNNRMGETAFNKTKEGIGNFVSGFIDVFVEIPAGIVGEISKKVATIGLYQTKISSDILLSNAIEFVNVPVANNMTMTRPEQDSSDESENEDDMGGNNTQQQQQQADMDDLPIPPPN